MKTACINCKNIRREFYPFPVAPPIIEDPECYAHPKIIDFDPIYGENYVYGYHKCEDFNTGDCENFISKYEEITKINKNIKKPFWKNLFNK
jgi:hypothetical protein